MADKRAYLRFNVQYAPAALLVHLPHSLEAGPVVVSREFCVLNEGAVLDQVPEALDGHEVVVLAIDLAGAGVAGRVWIGLVGVCGEREQHTGYAEAKVVRELCKETLEEGALPDAGGP